MQEVEEKRKDRRTHSDQLPVEEGRRGVDEVSWLPLTALKEIGLLSNKNEIAI